MTLMRISYRRNYCLTAIAIFSLTFYGCTDAPESENAIHRSIEQLLLDLDTAVSGSNEVALEGVISTARKLRPSSTTQTQSKNLLLATACGKLAKIKFQNISTDTHGISKTFELATYKSSKVADLRSAATVLAASGSQPNINREEIIKAAVVQLQSALEEQLVIANSRITALESQSSELRESAAAMRDKADQLLINAEEAGLIDGQKIFRSGIQAMRHSQQTDMSAAVIELESRLHDEAQRSDARAELEAIASILNAAQHTEELLRGIGNSANESSANLRQLADELDNDTAATMNEAVKNASELHTQWDNATSLIQDALQGAGRNRNVSRDAQQAAAMWKLDLEWSLGRIEEAKKQFLTEELQAISALIENEIVTSASKWEELSSNISNAIEQATLQSISAYENAKQLATKAGTRSDAYITQFETRINILQGKAIIPPPQNVPSAIGSTAPISTGGFATPEQLVEAFNALPSIMAKLDGTSPAPNLSMFYIVEDSASTQHIEFLQNISDASANLFMAIRTHLGEEAIEAMLSQQQLTPPVAEIMAKLDPSSVATQNDNEASVADVMGNSFLLRNTTQGWKIVFSTDNIGGAEMSGMVLEMMAPMIDAFNGVTQQINAGNITTLEQLGTALAASMGGF